MKLPEHELLSLSVVAEEPEIFVNFRFGIPFLLWVQGLVRGLEKLVLKNKLVVPLAGTVPSLTLKRALPIPGKELQRIPRRLRRGLLRARQS